MWPGYVGEDKKRFELECRWINFEAWREVTRQHASSLKAEMTRETKDVRKNIGNPRHRVGSDSTVQIQQIRW